MSSPNCGSLVPNGVRLSQVSVISQRLDAETPAKMPSKTGMPYIARRRSGSKTSW